MEAGKGIYRRVIARGVYWQEGEVVAARTDTGGYASNAELGQRWAGMDDAARQAVVDAGFAQVVPEWHYQLLDDEGYVLGHGDHYLSEEHVVSALAGVLDDGTEYGPGQPGQVHEMDAAQGKVSRSGSRHCLACGAKMEKRDKVCDACHAEQRPYPASAFLGPVTTTGLMLGMLAVAWAWFTTALLTLANFAENAINDAIFNNTALQESARYLKLHTGDPGEDATNNAAGETTRKSITGAASSSGVFTSVNDLAWTNVASTETYSHVSVWDAASSGNPYSVGALTASKSVTAGDNFTVATGSLTHTMD